MHELWHVILAHTRLYPRVTPAHNVAFDAVINAGLARELPGPEYRGFFEALNPAGSFPGLLLREPEGWPGRPAYPAAGPKGTQELVERLYPAGNPDGAEMPLYDELLELLERGGWQSEPCLLGEHADLESDERALDDALFGGVVRRIVASWPPPPFPLGGRDAGGAARDWHSALVPPSAEARAAFARVLRRTLGTRPGALARRARTQVAGTAGLGVLPSARDRLAPARRALGAPSALWLQPAPLRARVPERPSSASVYLDASGSMQELLPHLCGLLLPYVAGGRARAFQFSTEVAPLSLAELRRGRLTTTLGTDIRCVLEHALGERGPRRLLLLTDGYVGEPPEHLRRALADRRLSLHVVLPGESGYPGDLQELAASITVLPPLAGGSGL